MAGDFIQRSRHGTVFYFRRRVPLELRQRLGRLHFYVSLRTEELAEAKCRARALAVATDRLFTELRYLPGNKDDLVQLDYSLTLDHDALGRPQFKVTDVKPGDEASVEDLAKRLRGVATLAKLPTATLATPTVDEAIATVLADPGIKASTVKEYRRAFMFFRDQVGGDTPLGEITQERFARFADGVRDSESWQAKTKSFYITSAQRLFTHYASRNGAVPKITTAGLKPTREVPAGHDRAEYNMDEMAALFKHVGQYRKVEPAKWWVTVACAFLGTRIEELVQAHLDGDFRYDETSGVHYLQIDQIARIDPERARDYPKSVKSKAGWRKVPMHPALLEAGFLNFINDGRAAGAVTAFEQCWPALRSGSGRVKHGQFVSKWAGKEMTGLVASGTFARRLAYFHSMRHSFVTMLAKAGITEEWRAALTGHEFGGINSEIYTKAKQDVSFTFPMVEKGLDPLATLLRAVL